MTGPAGVRVAIGSSFGLVLALAVATGAKETHAANEVLWLSEGRRSAFEPTACFADDGRLWALWISCGGGERPSGRIEGACVEDGRVAARFSFEPQPYVAGVRVVPFGEGAYCVFESGKEEARQLLGRTLVFDAGEVALGELESIPTEAEKPLSPSVARVADELVLVHQGLAGTGYDLFHGRRGEEGWTTAEAIATTPEDEWHPRIVAGPSGGVHLVYDVFSGESFDVAHRALGRDAVGPERLLASGPDHQAYPEPSVAPDGALWVAWEVAPSFGEGGGLRAARDVRLARLTGGELRHVPPLRRRIRRRELPRPLATDAGLLLTYRAPEQAEAKKKSVYTSWSTSTVHFDAAEKRPVESALQGTDGNTEAEHVLLADALGSAWMVFATDGRKELFPRVTDWGQPIEGHWRIGLRALPAPRGLPELTAEAPPPLRSTPGVPPPRTGVAEGGERPLFGDLHRHTHLSRCSGAQDGTLEDAYRYARGSGGLDFIAVTDHWQHIRPWSWWRSVRDVVRYHAPGSLVTFAAVERVRPKRGHYNDVYLVPDEVPYDPDGWRRPPAAHAPVPDDHVVSIPHMLSIGGFDWDEHSDDRTRLYEVFQGTRGSYEGPGLPYEALSGVQESTAVAAGLDRGAHFGLIAASDHVSTRTAYAGVFAEGITRAAVFEALRERRTFGATDVRAVSARLGELEMGRRGPREEAGTELLVRLSGRAARDVAYVELVVDGETAARHGGTGRRETWVVSQRRGLPGRDKPLRIAVEGGRVVDFRLRRAGGHGVELERDGEAALLLTRAGILLEDVPIEIEWDEAKGGELVLSFDEEERRLPRHTLTPGRSKRLGVGQITLLVWRQGAPLAQRAEEEEVAELRFHVSPKPGRSYYARIAWTDGNLAWTSPIRIAEPTPEEPAEDER